MTTNPPERLTAEDLQELEDNISASGFNVSTIPNKDFLPIIKQARLYAKMKDVAEANGFSSLTEAMARASLRPLPGGEREWLARIIYDEMIRLELDHATDPISPTFAEMVANKARGKGANAHYYAALVAADAILLALSPPSSDWPEREADVAWLNSLRRVPLDVGSHDRIDRLTDILAHLPKQKGGI